MKAEERLLLQTKRHVPQRREQSQPPLVYRPHLLAKLNSGLNTFHSLGGSPPPVGHTGLHHVALLYPDRAALGEAVQRLVAHAWPIDAAEDHGATVSVYLRDPDDNGLEIYFDRPREHWVDEHGRPILKAEPFDWHELLDEM